MLDEVNRTDNIEIVGMGESPDGHLFSELCVSVGGRQRDRILSLQEFEAAPDAAPAVYQKFRGKCAVRGSFWRLLDRRAGRRKLVIDANPGPGFARRFHCAPHRPLTHRPRTANSEANNTTSVPSAEQRAFLRSCLT
jgi:hypothetical protein